MVAVAAGVWVGLMWIVAGAVGGHLLPQQTTSATVTTLPAYPTGAASKRECFCVLFTSRKAGQHVLLVQGGTGGHIAFSETSVHVQPL